MPPDFAARTCGLETGGGDLWAGLEVGASSREGEARRAAREWRVDWRFLIFAVLAIAKEIYGGLGYLLLLGGGVYSGGMEFSDVTGSKTRC